MNFISKNLTLLKTIKYFVDILSIVAYGNMGVMVIFVIAGLQRNDWSFISGNHYYTYTLICSLFVIPLTYLSWQIDKKIKRLQD